MSESTLATNIFSEKLGVDVCVEIEYEMTSEPNGKPDPMDKFSEGYDIVPEVTGVKIIEFIPPLEFSQKNIAILSTFEEDHAHEFDRMVSEYVDVISGGDDDFDEMDFGARG